MWADRVLIQTISFSETSLSGTLVDAVNISGILKKTLLTPGGELSISFLETVTSLHSGIAERILEIALKTPLNVLLVLLMVLLVRPPWI